MYACICNIPVCPSSSPQLMDKECYRDIEKIKTIGSTYMAAVGLVPTTGAKVPFQPMQLRVCVCVCVCTSDYTRTFLPFNLLKVLNTHSFVLSFNSFSSGCSCMCLHR